MNTLRLIILVIFAYYAGPLHALEPTAESTNIPVDMYTHSWVQSSNNDFVINIPSPALSDIQDQMHQTQLNLVARQNELELTVKEKEFSVKDGLITLILPGGILYAAAVKSNHIRAKKELREITDQLNEINNDISNLIAGQQHSILIARN